MASYTRGISKTTMFELLRLLEYSADPALQERAVACWQGLPAETKEEMQVRARSADVRRARIWGAAWNGALVSLRQRAELEQAPYPDICGERERQDAKWGVQNHDPRYWLAILGEEFGEAAKAIVQHNGARKLRAELVQVAAVAIAFIESLDRNELRGLPDDGPSDEEW
jgi:hypothetical protein